MSGELILYTTEDGKTKVQLRAEDGTVWLSQAEMADLFQTTPQNITQHIKAIYDEGEAIEEATCKNSLQVRKEGERHVQREITLYNLSIILAIGYRVRSLRGTQFRRWATTTLQEYMVKGFVLDDARLKEPAGGWDYFDELLERIREIRASEKRFYQKVRDLFAATSSDYQAGEEVAQTFFKKIQNKLLWAVTGQTAAELIIARSDPSKPNMGLLTFKGSRVRKGDIVVAKNYLNESELKELDRLVSAFLDLAQDRAEKRQDTTMEQWVEFVDNYLKLAERDVLKNPGSRSHETMLSIVGKRYEHFDTARKEAERTQAEKEYEQDIEADLKQIETHLVKAKSLEHKKKGKKQ